MPEHPIDGFELPRELGHGLEPNPSWDEVFVAKASPNVPMEEDMLGWGRARSEGSGLPNIVVNQSEHPQRGLCRWQRGPKHSPRDESCGGELST